MAENSAIQWCDDTFNHIIGCAKVSPGCVNCYAEVGPAAKFMGVEWGIGKQRVRTSESNWRKPLAWDRAAAKAGVRRKVFCASLADWLDPEIPVDVTADLLALIARTPNLDWLLLTKRPENWRAQMQRVVDEVASSPNASAFPEFVARDWLAGIAPPNVWIGTTVEDQRRADERIPHLLAIPARVRFLSCEPLLENVSLHRWLAKWWCPQHGELWRKTHDPVAHGFCDHRITKNEDRGKVDWVIIGGESGPRARPFDIAWARSIVAQCREAGVAAFVKQLGAKPVEQLRCLGCFGRSEDRNGRPRHCHHCDGTRTMSWPLHLRDSHGGDPAEWPQDLNIREFPKVEGTCGRLF